eukprot:5593060-Pleurochrysis_carterae.AAC.1
MGGGRALHMASDPEVVAHGMKPVPWAGVAAPLPDRGAPFAALASGGRPYCLLPLPSKTGLPMHVNGFFEVSSNRRDIWYGDDTMGGGKVRSDWNVALLVDAVVPCYVLALLKARDQLDTFEDIYHLFPQAQPAEPWAAMVSALYRVLAQQPLLHSEYDGG